MAALVEKRLLEYLLEKNIIGEKHTSVYPLTRTG
jgi:hypothetical protein